jgi:hypothetical protein
MLTRMNAMPRSDGTNGLGMSGVVPLIDALVVKIGLDLLDLRDLEAVQNVAASRILEAQRRP